MTNYDYSNLLSMIKKENIIKLEEIISFWIYYYNHSVPDIIQVRISPNVKAENQHNYGN